MWPQCLVPVGAWERGPASSGVALGGSAGPAGLTFPAASRRPSVDALTESEGAGLGRKGLGGGVRRQGRPCAGRSESCLPLLGAAAEPGRAFIGLAQPRFTKASLR